MTEEINPKILTINSEDFENQDHIQVYYLPSGIYKIVKSGEGINTEQNFLTFTLLPGQYMPYIVVLDEETKNIRGGGMTNNIFQQTKIKNWRLFGGAHGNINISHSNKVSTEELQTIYTVSAQVDFQARYDHKRHYFNTRNIFEEGWNKAGDNDFKGYLDNLETKNIYVFKFNKYVGLYGRLNLSTQLFNSFYYFNSDENINSVSIDDNGNIYQEKIKDGRFKISPSFYPLTLQQGLGFNLSFSPSYHFTLYIRNGIGFRQTYNKNIFEQIDQNEGYGFKSIENSSIRGYEFILYSQVQLSSNIFIISEIDLLYPILRKDLDLVYDFENIINIRLLNNISLDYTLRIEQDKNVSDKVQIENIIMLRYSYYFF